MTMVINPLAALAGLVSEMQAQDPQEDDSQGPSRPLAIQTKRRFDGDATDDSKPQAKVQRTERRAAAKATRPYNLTASGADEDGEDSSRASLGATQSSAGETGKQVSVDSQTTCGASEADDTSPSEAKAEPYKPNPAAYQGKPMYQCGALALSHMALCHVRRIFNCTARLESRVLLESPRPVLPSRAVLPAAS